MKHYNNIGLEEKTAVYFNGERITEYMYDTGDSKNNITVMQSGDMIDVFENHTGKKLYNLSGVEGFKIENNGIIISNGKRYGMITYYGKVILEAKFLKIDKCKDYLKTVDENRQIALYLWENNVLKEILPPQKCEDIRVHDEGIMLHRTINDKKCRGYYSLDGKEIIPPEFIEISFSSHGIYVTTPEDKKGVYSYLGKIIIPPIYFTIAHINKCFVVYFTLKNGKKGIGLYTEDGTEIITPRYDRFLSKPPYCMFEKNELYCLYDMVAGKRILPLKYKNITVYYNVLCATEDYKSINLFSGKTGKKLIENSFESVTLYEPYILKVAKKGHEYYYLITYNTLVDSEKYEVEYSEEYKEVLISRKEEKNKMLFTEWFNKQR